MATQAALGQKALDARDYPAAIAHYTEALKSSNSPVWLTNRSIAYTRQRSYDLALRDADEAVLSAMNRARRELIATAQLRRGVALFSLKRYGDARMCFTWARKLNEKEKGLGLWQAKVVMEFDKLPEDAEERKVTVKETPEKPTSLAETGTSKVTSAPSITATSQPSVAPTNTTAPTAKEKIRHEWFQSSSKVTITIFAKGVPKDQAEVSIRAQSLEVRFPIIASGSVYDFSLLPLFAKVDVAQSTYSITANKVEVSLHKAAAGLKWSSLEFNEPINEEASDTKKISPTSAVAPSIANTPSTAPAYPTSSRKGVKDWDAVAKDALKKENIATKDGKKEDTNTGGDDDDEDDSDPLNGFFKKLYKDADPDTRRAMMKSYVESNGTALSTNWQDVGSKKVETTPPDGLEAKKWGS